MKNRGIYSYHYTTNKAISKITNTLCVLNMAGYFKKKLSLVIQLISIQGTKTFSVSGMSLSKSLARKPSVLSKYLGKAFYDCHFHLNLKCKANQEKYNNKISFRVNAGVNLIKHQYCTALQCSPLRRKFMECYIIKPAQSLLMKHLVIGQR